MKGRDKIMFDRAKNMLDNPTVPEKLFADALKDLDVEYKSQVILKNTWLLLTVSKMVPFNLCPMKGEL